MARRAHLIERVQGPSGGETTKRHARVDHASLEDVRVCACEDAGHHRTRRCPDSENTLRVDAPVGEGEACRVRNAERVAPAIVGERLARGDIPAQVRMRLWVKDETEALNDRMLNTHRRGEQQKVPEGLCQLRELRSFEVDLRGTRADCANQGHHNQ